MPRKEFNQADALPSKNENQVVKITTPHEILPLSWSIWAWQQSRKLVVLVMGLTLLAIGIAGLVLPVIPGLVTIIAGLALLATEFAWARWILTKSRERIAQLVKIADSRKRKA